MSKRSDLPHTWWPPVGGMRHGTVLKDADELSEGEARLVCDPTRSDIASLLHQHQRFGLG